MPKAKRKGNTVVLEMDLEQAVRVLKYLGMHSLSSSLNTYPTFSALYDVLGDKWSPLASMELAKRVTLDANGLVKIIDE